MVDNVLKTTQEIITSKKQCSLCLCQNPKYTQALYKTNT